MDLIEEGEFFPLNSTNRRQAIEMVLGKMQDNPRGVIDKGKLVSCLHGEIYSNRQDCKDFLKNLQRSSNHEVNSLSQRKLVLGRETEVIVQ